MRTPLASLAGLAVLLCLAACGSQKSTEVAPETSRPAEQTAVMPDDAPPQEEADAASPPDTAREAEASCLDELGASASARLVKRCIAVSPATHPPCNAANPCTMIRDEIDRSCALFGPGETRPGECAG